MVRLIIRKAKKEDFKSMKNLLKQLYPKKRMADIKSRLFNKQFFIAKYGKKIIGLISLNVLLGPIAWIYHLVVKPEFRRKGVGKKLLKKSICFAKKKSCKLLFLSVFINKLKRKKAHRFYSTNKFKNFFLFYYRKI